MSDIHQDLKKVIQLIKEHHLIPPKTATPQETRAHLGKISRLVSQGSLPLPLEKDISFEINGRAISTKLYLPDPERGHLDLLFYCHGGGFRHGAIEDWDAPLRQLARTSGVAILSIDYALAPENRFPRALEDITAIIKMVLAQGSIDGKAIRQSGLGGDSAGANLALSSALILKNDGFDAFRYLLLFYGVYARELSSPSWSEFGDCGGFGLSPSSMASHWQDYLENDEHDWRVQPLYGDVAGLPPTRLVVGGRDPLLDQNRLLEQKLRASGVAVSLKVAEHLIHGFVRFNEVAPVVRNLLAEEAVLLESAFAKNQIGSSHSTLNQDQ